MVLALAGIIIALTLVLLYVIVGKSKTVPNFDATAIKLDLIKESQEQGAQIRKEATDGRKELSENLQNSLKEIREQVEKLTASNDQKQERIRETLETQITTLRNENSKKLEEMRNTVDEKLQETLEKRIGSSFKTVQEQLENVHKGLGEMQNLAKDVGNLSKVLTNVKSRGGWGEVQLARQLEDMLSPDQYEANVSIEPNSREVVEFAIKLPGKDEDTIYLPIDSKFPQEDYERLQAAQEQADKELIEEYGKALEREIKVQAKKINEKYIKPPYSTNFAIMYLPTEGLFAEILRRPGLIQTLQLEYRVTVAGPTTLNAFLHALQMGFSTLKISAQSNEVWRILGNVKSEFNKYGKVWEKLEKQLGTAQKTVKEVGTRSKILEKSLGSVESNTAAEIPDFAQILSNASLDEEIAELEEDNLED